MTHFPPHIKPLSYETVLLIHYFDSDREPMVMTGFIDGLGQWIWHDPDLRDDDTDEPYVVHAWMPLPLIPERP